MLGGKLLAILNLSTSQAIVHPILSVRRAAYFGNLSVLPVVGGLEPDAGGDDTAQLVGADLSSFKAGTYYCRFGEV